MYSNLRKLALMWILIFYTPMAFSEDKCQQKVLAEFPELPNQTVQKFSIREYWVRTDKLTEDGTSKERECSFVVSFNHPDDNRVWVEASTTNIVSASKRNESPKCWVDFEDYVETIPGIKEPKTAIFKAFAKTGGSFKVGRYGETWCISEAEYTR